MIHQPTNSRGNYNYNAFIYDGVAWASHFHRNFELIYAIHGENVVYADGIGYTLSSGELLLIPPGTIHSFTVKKGTQVWVGVFSSDYVSFFAQKNKGKFYSTFRCSNEAEEYLKKTLFITDEPDIYTLKAALYTVCAQCVKNAKLLEEKPNVGTAIKILEYVSLSFDKDISMKSTAEELGYEYHYFSRIFHECFSMKFTELLNICRFDKACELMKNSDLSLTSIAMESGFKSTRNFNTVFKSLSGKTPSEYRTNFK